MTALHAVIFDVDGVLADTERDGHRPAFNAAFALHGLDIHWDADEYGELLAITGGRRRLAHDLRNRGFGKSAERMAAQIHLTKTRLFRDTILEGAVTGRPGLVDLVASLRDAGIRIAVATTGDRAWVRPLIAELLGADGVEVAVTGNDVRRLKPDPEVYRRTLSALELEPERTLAVEDSAVGLRAAVGAGIATVVVSTPYTAEQDFRQAAEVRTGFDGPHPLRAEGCRLIHRRHWAGRSPACLGRV